MDRPGINENILSIVASLNSGQRLSVKKLDLHDMDWRAIVETIQKSGMAGYFYTLFFQTEAASNIPATVIETLRKSSRRVAAQNAFYESQCVRVLKGLSAAGVENIILKGLSYMQDI